MKTSGRPVNGLQSLTAERRYGPLRVTATLPDDDEESDPITFTGWATEFQIEDDEDGRTIHAYFGSPSPEFLDATEASAFELIGEYNSDGECTEITGKYLMPPVEEMTLRYGEICVQSVERVEEET